MSVFDNVFNGRFLVLFLVVFSSAVLRAQSQPAIPAILPSDSIKHVFAPIFVLKDLKGNEVSLAYYKGKVVVIDFWATWCAPCHQTLPFVEKTMEKYKNDAGVQFVFIDTKEKAENRVELVEKFAARHSASFKILLDEVGDSGKQDKWSKAFGAQYLPTRFVIDGKGFIRFVSLGYPSDHSDDKLSQILSGMIEAAKKSD